MLLTFSAVMTIASCPRNATAVWMRYVCNELACKQYCLQTNHELQRVAVNRVFTQPPYSSFGTNLAGVSSSHAFTPPVEAISSQVDSGVHPPDLGPVLPLHLLRLHVLLEQLIILSKLQSSSLVTRLCLASQALQDQAGQPCDTAHLLACLLHGTQCRCLCLASQALHDQVGQPCETAHLLYLACLCQAEASTLCCAVSWYHGYGSSISTACSLFVRWQAAHDRLPAHAHVV